MIEQTTLNSAVAEAHRFIASANALQMVRAIPPQMIVLGGAPYARHASEVKEHAATKRASMDLSRVLAALRTGR